MEKYFEVGMPVWAIIRAEVRQGEVIGIELEHEGTFGSVIAKFDEETWRYNRDGRSLFKGMTGLFQKSFKLPKNEPLCDNLAVGDRVKCLIYGYGTVRDIYPKRAKPLLVLFDRGNADFYRKDGKLSKKDREPILTRA